MKIPQTATEPSAIIIPFGKHKGATVAEVLAKDPQYAEWMTAQGWIAERFAELHAAIVSRGAGTDDTLEHNALQARFLEPLFRSVFVRILLRSEKKFHTEVRFEQNGVDVILCWSDGSYTIQDFHFNSKEDWENRSRAKIELKPTLGDDYPSVMRQMQRLKCNVIVVGQYTGRGVSEPQLRQMFRANRFAMVFVQEIEEQLRTIEHT